MGTLKINKDYQDHIVAFGGGGKLPLGQRSQEDLVALAKLSYSNKRLARFFDGEIPSLADLQKLSEATAQKASGLPNQKQTVPAPTPTEAVKVK